MERAGLGEGVRVRRKAETVLAAHRNTQSLSVTLSGPHKFTCSCLCFWQGSKGPADSIYVLSHLIFFMLSPHTHIHLHSFLFSFSSTKDMSTHTVHEACQHIKVFVYVFNTQGMFLKLKNRLMTLQTHLFLCVMASEC